MKSFLYFLVMILLPALAFSQGVTRETFHDKEKRNLKEVYQVKDTLSNILQGKYISYYLNGNVESKGEFAHNETIGVWEFYYETGKLKMRGVLKQNANFGHWEYFYENGQMSMEGSINGTKREGIWKTYYENRQLKEEGEYTNNRRTGIWKNYFEDGAIRGEVDYKDDFGRYTEYYRSGKVLGEGPRMGSVQVGHWRYYSEDATLHSEGDFEKGKRVGEWIYYYSDGVISAKGKYSSDEKSGHWEYYFKDGSISSSGDYVHDQKDGSWKTRNEDGSTKSEVNFVEGKGEYHEYDKSGNVLAKGNIVNDKREGNWQFFSANGKLEGECEYTEGKGMYRGYYDNGSLQTKGEMDEDRKVGTWEIYETDGKLSGYYRPFYENKKLSEEIAKLAGRSQINRPYVRGTHFKYFDPKFNEHKGMIIGTNPFFLIAGRLPLAVEFYNEKRLGHEFEFIGIREPFFQIDQNIAPGKKFIRGYSACIKQKFYNPLKAGMWYFGHEIRFTNMGHFTNITIPQIPDAVFTISSVEQRIEYGLLLGYRIMKNRNASGFTLDIFTSYDIGYRGFDVDKKYETYFANLNQSNLSTSFHFGLNFGNVFSYR